MLWLLYVANPENTNSQCLLHTISKLQDGQCLRIIYVFFDCNTSYARALSYELIPDSAGHPVSVPGLCRLRLLGCHLLGCHLLDDRLLGGLLDDRLLLGGLHICGTVPPLLRPCVCLAVSRCRSCRIINLGCVLRRRIPQVQQ